MSNIFVATQRQSARVFAALAAFSLSLCLTGCASAFYTRTPAGTFAGKLTVEWVAPNQFIYRPDKSDPLRFTTADGRVIRPQLMYTDGGSIPRLFWFAPGLGPWDFGPPYVIHDWLFHQHHCLIDDWQAYDFPTSAQILAEGMKTQMQKDGKPEVSIVYAVYEAVKSPIAEELWNKGSCTVPPSLSSAPLGGAGAPLVILRIDAK